MSELAVVEPWIQTYTGKQFWALNPREEMIDIVDIAHALANTCRYSGHCNRFYSVARHSIEVAKLVHPRLKMIALLHDSAEAYLTDIPSPFKGLFPGYRDVEDDILSVILKKFGMERYSLPMEVHEADHLMLLSEAPQLGLRWADNMGEGIPGYVLPPSNPDDDKAAFMAHFYLYGGKLND